MNNINDNKLWYINLWKIPIINIVNTKMLFTRNILFFYFLFLFYTQTIKTTGQLVALSFFRYIVLTEKKKRLK